MSFVACGIRPYASPGPPPFRLVTVTEATDALGAQVTAGSHALPGVAS
jgi:hypothetical protein